MTKKTRTWVAVGSVLAVGCGAAPDGTSGGDPADGGARAGEHEKRDAGHDAQRWDSTASLDATRETATDVRPPGDSSSVPDTSDPRDAPGERDAPREAAMDARPVVDARSEGSAADAGPMVDASGEAGCSGATPVALTALNVLVWCSVSVAGGAASSAAQQTVCVAPGVVSLAASPLPGFELGPAPWHDTSGDLGSGDPGTVSGGTDTTTVSVTSGARCVWVCCPFPDGSGCPTTDQCP